LVLRIGSYQSPDCNRSAPVTLFVPLIVPEAAPTNSADMLYLRYAGVGWEAAEPAAWSDWMKALAEHW
jgi:hypothetical protein